MRNSIKLQTIVELPTFSWRTGYLKPTLFMGSCFTENIGNRMNELKFTVDINPFGILYNPASVAGGLRTLMKKKHFSDEDLIRHHGLWHSFSHHSRFSHSDREQILENINHRIDASSGFLKNAAFLMVTFGTAWVYENRSTGQTVANCHKLPAKEFRRFRLTPGEIVGEYRQLLGELWNYNPSVKVLFTVSPIRHWKDGAVENQRSKATLLLAIDQLIRGFGEEQCNYFPAYEIMMDELRDYRFYEDDMIHPSSTAINYLWGKFQDALIDTDGVKISEEVKKIKKTMNHKPFNRFSKEHCSFLDQSLRKTYELEKKFPYLNLEFEKNHFLSEIHTIERGMNKK